jgi:hypothetical protein
MVDRLINASIDTTDRFPCRHCHRQIIFLLTLIRMTKDEKGLAFFKGLLQKIKKISNPSLLSLLSSEPNFLLIK